MSVADPAQGERAAAAAAPGESDQERLKRSSATALATSVGSQGVLFVMRFAYQVAIARLLAPEDFGLVALTAPVIAFIGMFADLGLTAATVQRREIDRSQLSFLFWVNVGASVAIGALCVAIGPPVARFYGDPRVTAIMTALGGLILMGGLFSQHVALLRRDMRFAAVAAANVLSFAAGSLAGLASALLGAGYWAIVANQFATSLAMMLFAWAATRWVPGRPGPFAQMKPLLRFGGDVTGFNVVDFVSRGSAGILLGRFAGEVPLGLYDRAYKLVLLPFHQVAGPFGAVAVPLLSRSQDEPEFYRRAYQRMLETSLLLFYPGLVFMMVNGAALISPTLGSRWGGVAPVFTLLAADAFAAPVRMSMGWLFVSQGRTREMRDCGVLASVVFVACFVAGLPWGGAGAWPAATWPPGWSRSRCLTRVGTRRGPLRGRDLRRSLAPFSVAVAAAFAAGCGLRLVSPAGAAGLLLQGACAYASFAAALATTPRGRRMMRHVAFQLRGLAARRRTRVA